MNRTLLKVFGILVVIVLVIGVGFFGVKLFSNKSTQTATSTNPFGQNGLTAGTTTGAISGSAITIFTKTGTPISVPEFTSGHQVTKQDAGSFYYLTEDTQGNSQTDEFGIVYGTDSSISIGLFKEPLSQTRLNAEAALRKYIPLSNAELCSLNVTVSVPQSINEYYSAQELGLSFCSGAVRLPQ